MGSAMQCYFGCDEPFKKDFQLHLHLKLKHRNEPAEELAKAYAFADEEIALTRRSASTFQCALCQKQFNDNGAFYGHIQTKHNMQWKEYKDKYGRCEIESAPFECQICNRVIKYDRNTVHTHLKNVHGINWSLYLDRVRKLKRGETPDELPQVETTECLICNTSVKYIKEHIKNSHKITEQEYELFVNEKAEEQQQQQQQQQQVDNVPMAKEEKLTKPPKSDIQDKTNKNCSSCEISFESRRGFIEHCTTVHKMKFKTKSGLTIAAPAAVSPMQKEPEKKTSPSPPEQPSSNPPPPLLHSLLKRKAADNNDHHEDGGEFVHPPPPPLKKLASSSSSSSTSGDEAANVNNSLHMSPQYSPSGVSKWNQCRVSQRF